LARGFWGKAWKQNLDETMPEISKLKNKARNYVRNNGLCHLAISEGSISAKVSGDRLYDVEISVEPLPRENWEAIVAKCNGKVYGLRELLAGKVYRHVISALLDPSMGFLPQEREIRSKCSCGSEQPVCEHAAAAIYGVAARLDADSTYLFTLRGADPCDLIDPEARARPAAPKDGAPLQEASPVSLADSLEATPAVVLRRRNGEEKRLELREKPADEARAEEQAPQNSQAEDAEGYPSPKKRRLSRTFSRRRKRTGWVSVDVDGLDGEGALEGQEPFQDSQRGEGGLSSGGLPPEAAGESSFGETPASKKRGRPRNPASEPLPAKPPRPPRKRTPKPAIEEDTEERIAERRLDREKRLLKAVGYIKGTAQKEQRKRERGSSDGEFSTKFPERLAAPVPDIDFDRVTSKNVRDLRKCMGWNLDAFSCRLGVSKATAARWEYSRGALFLYSPTLAALKKLYAKILRKY
jgi:uncharacterized Zn finger protein/DNA-binding transcriptional regulator YiaG